MKIEDITDWNDLTESGMPVEKGTLVDVVRRDGHFGTLNYAGTDRYKEESVGRSCAENWNIDGVGGDTAKWRLSDDLSYKIEETE